MKRILLILGCMIGFTVMSHAAYTYNTYASTSVATIWNAPARLQNFEVVNSSNVAQTVNFYDGSVSASNLIWSVIVPASSSIARHFEDFIYFKTKVNVTSQDLYGNNKVQIFISNQ
jgi:hypothetical protein